MNDIMMAEMNKKVWIEEKGKRRQVTKSELTWTQLMNKAASGDTKSAKLALDYYHQGVALDEAKRAGVPMSLVEREAIDNAMLAAMRETLAGYAPEATDAVPR